MTGDITIGTNQIPSGSLDVVIVLTNAAGQVVGADYDHHSNLPAVLTPGLRIAIRGDVPATSMPTAATIYAAPDAYDVGRAPVTNTSAPEALRFSRPIRTVSLARKGFFVHWVRRCSTRGTSMSFPRES